MVIGIIGYLKSGKDTVADLIMAKIEGKAVFKKYSFAGPLKEATKALFGWSDEHVHDQDLKELVDPNWGISPRTALQLIGTDIMRDYFPSIAPSEFKSKIKNNFWVERFKSTVKNYPENNYIISDARFDNECQAIKDMGGIIVRVHRDSVVPKEIKHPSENVELLNRHININIYNNGSIEELWKAVDVVVDYILGRPE